MALSTQNTSLQLVAGTLGSQARLQAGAEHLFVHNKGVYARIMLFRGPRPSQLERDNHLFLLEGASLVGSTFVGYWEIDCRLGVQLAVRHDYFAGDGDPVFGKELHAFPADPEQLIPNESQDFFHAVFPRDKPRTSRIQGATSPYSQEGLVGGNGAAPTWGLVSFDNISISSAVHLHHGNVMSAVAALGTPAGRMRQFCAFVPRAEFNHYITVGDWRDEPNANLTLYRGAESGQESATNVITPQRLRMRMTPITTVPMGN